MKTKLLSVFALTTFLSFTSFAQSTIQEQVTNEIEKLNSKIAELEDSITIEVENMKLIFPDLERASKKFEGLVKKESANFQQTLKTIPKTLSAAISKQESEYLAVVEAAKENPKDEILQKLVLAKKKEMDTIIRDTETKVRKVYSDALINFIVLGQKVDLSLSKQWAKSRRAYKIAKRVPDFLTDGLLHEFYLKNKYYFVEYSISGDTFRAFGWHVDYEGANAIKLYDDYCKTQGCVYKMSEVYESYFEQALALNQPVQLSENLTLEQEYLPEFEEIQQTIRDATNYAVQSRPVGEFQIEE